MSCTFFFETKIHDFIVHCISAIRPLFSTAQNRKHNRPKKTPKSIGSAVPYSSVNFCSGGVSGTRPGED